jgi:predicted MFS family arabinose efflux permease
MGKDYWTIWAATLLFFVAFYTLLIPFPLYLADVGLPDWQIAGVMGALGIASLVVRPLAGVFSDSWGRRRVMLAGTGALVVGAVFVFLTKNAALLFFLRILQATGYAAFTTAATAMVSDLAPPERRGSAMALFGTAANVSMTTTPALVNAVLDRIQLSGAFLLSGVLAIVSLVVALQVRQETKTKRQVFSWTDLLGVANRLLVPAAAATLFGIAFGAFFQFLPLLTERRGLGPAGLVFTVYGGSIILTRLVTGRMLDRYNPGGILLAAFLLLGAGLSGFAVAGSKVYLFSATIVTAVGSGVLHPLLISIHVGRVSPTERGRASAVFYLGFDLGIGMGAWMYSPVFQWYGITGLFLVAAVVALFGAVPSWTMAVSDTAEQ